MFCKSVINQLSNIGKNNLKHIDKITITIHNQSTVSSYSIFRTAMYKSEIVFKKEDLYVTKEANYNDFEKLIKNIKLTIDNEVKI